MDDSECIKTVELTEVGAFLLYRAIATEALEEIGFIGNAWAASADFDASFMEIMDKDLELWDALIMCDALEYKISDPSSFLKSH